MSAAKLKFSPLKDRNAKEHTYTCTYICIYIYIHTQTRVCNINIKTAISASPFGNRIHILFLLQQYSQNYAADCATQAAGSRCTCRCILNRDNKSISAAFWSSQVCLKNMYVSCLVRVSTNLLWSSRATECNVFAMSCFPVNVLGFVF